MNVFRKSFLRKFALFAAVALAVVAVPVMTHAQLVLSIGIAPPPLPVYTQPACPQVGYLWTPGYWAYGPDGYFWIPGTWVQPPTVGVLWTPGYWGWNNGMYAFNQGYWGPTVGFYGGVSYGFGYNGDGFYGGRWQGGQFAYNSSVTNIHITNVHVYNETVVNHNVRTSFNGPNGISARPTSQQEAYMHERHTPMTSAQTEHINGAAKDPSFRYANNHGAPAVAATARPATFKGPGVVKASSAGGKYNPALAKPASAAKTTPNENRPAPSKGLANSKQSPAKNTATDRPAGSAYTKPTNRATSPMGNSPANRSSSGTHATQPATRPAPAHEAAPKPAPKPAPAAKPAPRPAPETRPAPAAHPAPAEHMAPAPHAAPAPHPAPAAHPAPAPHEEPHK